MGMNAGFIKVGDVIQIIDSYYNSFVSVATESGYFSVPDSTIVARVNNELRINLGMPRIIIDMFGKSILYEDLYDHYLKRLEYGP